ncbi:family 93 glycoside hydrolase [Cryphonectria parasitica EP155]|uniref:Family 93 glycoside hydrolase n=1 Tax=Cryphonectria parasitica (strain ATCC 38755 / EP155) TaxID=660469 RepID=A0A9P4XZI1_CRYP1|nr:family 93 glycoside hydrolase [Cryphonectria parasitica EP155]KAF3763645.1 family 93 glycoside hydrolase [Cryphonectria parasitica EP155]
MVSLKSLTLLFTDPRVLYARTVELTLSDNILLATWENYSPEPPPVYFPIYRSTDHGATWKHISNCTDQVNGWGLRYQPFLYELPVDYAGFDKGTVLLAGNSIPTNLSNTQIDLYASRDKGETWEFVSHVAAGGEALPDNGLTPVWEPFIMMYDNQVIIYYSDQRLNATYGQRLVHQTSTDLRNWGSVVPDVEYPVYTDRPGMTTVTQLPSGDYIMTYEWGHYTNVTAGTYLFPVTYRINANPLRFNESVGQPIVAANTGNVPLGSPYITWSSVGGENGTIIVSSGGASTVFTNTKLGDPSAWEEKETTAPTSYTRHLRVFKENQDRLLIMGGGALPPSTTNNVSLSILSIEGLQSA